MLIRRLHTLRGACAMTQDEYLTLLESYGVESPKELDERQLQSLCDFMQKRLGNNAADQDTQRKRLLAAVCGLCKDIVDGWEAMSRTQRIAYAKAVACRAAGWEEPWDKRGRSRFNSIGLDRLRSLTYAFQKRKRDMDGVIHAAMDVLVKN